MKKEENSSPTNKQSEIKPWKPIPMDFLIEI